MRCRRPAQSRRARGVRGGRDLDRPMGRERRPGRPPARCAAIAARAAASPSPSSAAVGSSSSHIGAGDATSRASASRRRCPADSQRHGQSAMRVEPERGRAPRRAAPRDAAHRAAPPRTHSVSRGGQRRLDRVEMADIVEPGAMRLAVVGDRAAAPEQPARRRRGQRRRQRRSRLDLPLPLAPVSTSAPPAADGTRPGEHQPLAAAAGEASRDQDRAQDRNRGVADRSCERRTAKKRLRRGKSGAALSRPNCSTGTRFGGQTCKDEPYACYLGGRLGLP